MKPFGLRITQFPRVRAGSRSQIFDLRRLRLSFVSDRGYSDALPRIAKVRTNEVVSSEAFYA